MGAAAVLAAVTVASTVIGGVVTARGQAVQAASASAAANYRSQVLRNNEIIANQRAEDARQRGKIAERQQRIKTAQRIGAARARAAGRGVLVDEGSAGDITADLATVGELDALTIRSNAEREAIGFEQTGQNYAAESNLRSLEADSAKKAGKTAVAGTLITTAGKVASQWSSYKSATS